MQSEPGVPIGHCREAAPERASPTYEPNAGRPACRHPAGPRSEGWTQAPPQSDRSHINSKAPKINR